MQKAWLGKEEKEEEGEEEEEEEQEEEMLIMRPSLLHTINFLLLLTSHNLLLENMNLCSYKYTFPNINSLENKKLSCSVLFFVLPYFLE